MNILANIFLQTDDGGGFLLIALSLLCGFTFLIVFIVGEWRIFTKAGQPGWAAIVPIYNFYVLMKIIGRPGWWVILYFIPGVFFVVTLINGIDLAKSFGKSTAYGVIVLWVFYGLGQVILGFSDAEYQGPSVT